MSMYYDPPVGHAAVTPSNTAFLPETTTCLYVGAAGDVAAATRDGAIVVYKNVPAGAYLVGRFAQVRQTGTTAGNIVAGYA